jgi:hypothetical protein
LQALQQMAVARVGRSWAIRFSLIATMGFVAERLPYVPMT